MLDNEAVELQRTSRHEEPTCARLECGQYAIQHLEFVIQAVEATFNGVLRFKYYDNKATANAQVVVLPYEN